MKYPIIALLLISCAKEPISLQVGMMYHIKSDVFNKGVFQPKQPVRVERLYIDEASGYPYAECTDMDNIRW